MCLMIKVHLRKKKLKTGKLSLYIEFYKGIQTLENGKTKHLRDYEYLQLYLKQNPKSAAEKKKNQEQLELAEQILAIRKVEVYQGKYNIQNDNKGKIGLLPGPMCRTVEDVARVLEIIAGNDNNDLLTIHSQNKIPNNYTQFLQADGLKGSRIGILREISETEPVPEIRVLFEKAINDMRLMGAEIIDSVKIPNYSKLSGNPWCTNFKSSIKMYLTKYIDEDSLQTIDDIIRIGTKS